MSRAPMRVLPPVGEAIRLQRPSQSPGAAFDTPGRVAYVQSGTAALALILRSLAERARESGSQANEVLIPAYGCPDVVSAVAFAGCRASLVDFEGPAPYPTAAAWSQAIGPATLALVSVGFLGLRDPFTPREAAARGLPEGSFVEDCCQVHPMAAPPTIDRNIALSFGRGKPVSALHGGAAGFVPALERRWARHVAPAGGLASFTKIGLSVRLYNVLRLPWLYGWVTRLPGLGVGQTEYAPLDAIELMNAAVRERLDLGRGWQDSRREALQRRMRQGLLDAQPGALAADLWRVYGKDGDWLLRYPVLLCSREARDIALGRLNAAGLGASAMYGQALMDIPGIRSLVATPGATPGASAFADRLLTLPLHAEVQDRDVKSMCDILAGVSRT
jgi:dTDP-4-amino-4,6-dideoxygalactose transaminase